MADSANWDKGARPEGWSDGHEAVFGDLLREGESEDYAKDILSPVRAREQWEMFKDLAKIEPEAGESFLEIGSGFGTLMHVAREAGLDAYGIDPQQWKLKHSKTLLSHGGEFNVVDGFGEALPYADASFDYVYSTNVLEHVQDPDRVVHESLRVLKPGGYLQFVVPNYGSWWEGHYGIIWPPNISPGLAKVYVRLLGKDPDLVDGLRFVNHAWLTRILDAWDGEVEVLDWGVDLWEYRCRSLDFSGWNSLSTLKRIMRVVKTLKLVEPIIWLGRKLHWEHPFMLTLRKVR